MTVFYLVHHAHADWTPDEQRPLSKCGQQDAPRVVDILQAYPVGAIYSSPSLRARQTVEPLAEQLSLPVLVEPDLRERELSAEPIEDFFAAVEKTWRDPSFAHPGGESNAAAQERGLGVVRKLLQKYNREGLIEKQIALSTHGNLLALILQGFDPSIDFGFWKEMSMPDIYKLSLREADPVEIKRLW
ncbi:MAG: histidine phosphatase family protein [Anaerolineales bacterium]|nr:histidine phosphatase family protein [Anaerolineales bacterium]